jgi:hypothetical protein
VRRGSRCKDIGTGYPEAQSKSAGRCAFAFQASASQAYRLVRHSAEYSARRRKPDLRCGTLGTSGHVTTKSSIRNWGVLYKSGAYALKATCLTPGGLLCVPHSAGLRIEQSILTAWEPASPLGLWRAKELCCLSGRSSKERRPKGI